MLTKSADYLSWAREFVARKKNKPNLILTDDKYNRKNDLFLFRQLKALTRKHTHSYPLHTITNEPREQKRFFRAFYQNKTYNPDFHYQKKPSLSYQNSYLLIQKLEKLSRVIKNDTNLDQIYQRRIFDAEKAIILNVLSQKKGFSWASAAYYNVKKTLKIPAHHTLNFPYNHQESIEAYEIAYLAQRVILDLGLKHKASITSSALRFRGLSTTKSKIGIGVGTLRSPAHIIRSLAHEILGHAIASTNAKTYPAFFARRNSSLSLLKEEGLAVKIAEIAYQKLKIYLPSALRSKKEDFIPYLRLKTILLARKYSFYETFLALTKLKINDPLAWELTVRAKRGTKNTAKVGANFHDALYYLGLQKINRTIKNANLNFETVPEFFNKLVQGKFDFREFIFLNKNFPHYTNLNFPEYFQRFEKIFQLILQNKFKRKKV